MRAASTGGSEVIKRDELWDALVLERDRAVRVARSRGAPPDDVDDVVQEATARVAAMEDVDVARVGPLLTVVVANLVTDQHRTRVRSARLEKRLAAQLLHASSPDEAVCDDAEARWLHSVAAELLSEQDRRVLELRAQGLSVGASAEALGVTYKAAERALARARARMKKAWSATAALAGLLLGRPWSKGQAATPAAAMAAAVVAVAIGGWGQLAPPAEAAPLAEAPAPVGSPVPQPRSTGSVPTQARQAPPAAPRPAPAASRDPSGSRIAGTGPVRVGRLETAQSVERRREDETLLETAQRCLRDGLVVSQSYVGCPS